MNLTFTKIRDSLRLRKSVPATRPSVDPNAPTTELVRAPELPPVASRMVKCAGQRKYALRYEGEFYARF